MIGDEGGARRWVRELIGGDAATMSRLDRLCIMLARENQEQNLVSRGSLSQVWQRHIADSAQLLLHVPRETITSWLDLGTGAGFPGLVVAILCPDIKVSMIEVRTRRVAWLKAACSALDLRLAQVIGSRVESAPDASYDVVSARAFAPLGELLASSARFSTKSTTWVLPKGRSAAQELLELSGWQHTFHVAPSITDPDAGIVVGTLTGQKGGTP